MSSSGRTANPAATILHADQEHTGIRVAVPLVIVVVFLIVYLVAFGYLNNLPPGGAGDYAFVLSCGVALPLGLVVAALAEKFLKQTWHSGRSFQLDGHGIRVEIPGQDAVPFDAEKRYSQLRWYFLLKGYPKGGRERRVVSSWLCVACQVQQDDDRFIAYTFMPPGRAEPLTDRRDFHQIRPGEFFDGGAVRNFFRAPSRPTLPSNLLAGNEGQYWLAERRRWEEGMELTPEDFETLLNWLDEHQQE